MNDLSAALGNLTTRSENNEEIMVYLQILEERHERLLEANEILITYMYERDDVTDDDIATEIATNDEYNQKFLRARFAARNAIRITTANEATTNTPTVSRVDALLPATVSTSMNQMKLSKIELKKYDGDVKEWLRFWSQFKKIHENPAVDKETKFQYLIQAMVPGSRAAELVGSFPPTDENYEKIITAIKNRFGRDEILVEVYMRELLKLVMQNVMKPDEKMKRACTIR